MKKTLTLILIAISICISASEIIAQEYEKNLLWMVVNNENVFKDIQDNKITSNTNLNEVFQVNGVSNVFQVFPASKIDRLQRIYQVEFSGDIDQLIGELSIFQSQLFQEIKKRPKENFVALYDPSDSHWNYPSTDPNSQDNWTWFLRKIQADKAWDITKGNPNVKIGILDTWFDINHPDLESQILKDFDPYDNTPYNSNPNKNHHGTAVAGFAAAETDGGGAMPGVGFNCKMICYQAWAGNYLARAHHASLVEGVDILTSSAGGWRCSNTEDPDEKLAVKEILDNGTTIIMPAGNGDNGTHCQPSGSLTHAAFFPLSPVYDERIIIVTSTDINDNHEWIRNGTNVTHSHYPEVDLCSPGYKMMTLGGTQNADGTPSEWPYGSWEWGSGTSYATPIVAGTAALIKSVNPCLKPREIQSILKGTTDEVNDAAKFEGIIGTGRLNAYQAVKVAKEMYTESIDLYIKDRDEDFGNEQHPYHWQADRDKSPDIWVRNKDDGYLVQESEQPEYDPANPVFVYVRVRNKSCATSSGSEQLSLYWSKASSWSSWPQNWDGSSPNTGDNIGTINIPSLEAGADTILKFTWNIINPYIYKNWSSCLLTRIENSSVDDIKIHPDRLDDDVYFNNNIAMRNVVIVDNKKRKLISDLLSLPSNILRNGKGVLPGSFMYIGNPTSKAQTFDFEFDGQETPSLLTESELNVLFDEDGWRLLESTLRNTVGIEVLDERVIRLNKNKVRLENVTFPANTRVPIYIGANFLIDNILFKEKDYMYHVRQFMSSGDSILGGVHYLFKKSERSIFEAFAGNDIEINKGSLTFLNAKDIGEEATYNWYTEEGELVGSGQRIPITPESTKNYSLEVIASLDGFKDYDNVKIKVNPFYIVSVSPNPAFNNVRVEYLADEASQAKLVLINTSTLNTTEYNIDKDNSIAKINVKALKAGVYTLQLICDDIVADSRQIIIL